jgi:hypothetical protein
MDLTPFLRPLCTRRFATLQRMDIVTTQEEVLLNLVRRAQHTQFGKDHGFCRIKSVRDFQRQVPVRQFDDFWGEYWQKPWPILRDVSWPGQIPFFAKTSGTTTGKTKHIPITKEIIKANERAGFDLMTFHMTHNPASRPLAGRSFIIGGTTSLEQVAPNVYCGDVSGINTKVTPFWIKPHIFPPKNLALISNWDEKLDTLARQVLDQHITMLSGPCNWVLAMLDRIRSFQQKRSRAGGPTFPDLQLFIHGGVPIDTYRKRLRPHFVGTDVDQREMYPTSEGFIAVADRGPGEGLRLMADNKLFFEFIPLEDLGSPTPRRHWVADIEKHLDYALVLSNCAGMWSYLLGDIVRFVDTRPPRLLILGRVSQKLNSFGEHLIAAELEEAVQSLSHTFGLDVAEFTVGPVLPDRSGEPGFHVFVLEPLSGNLQVTKNHSEQFSGHIDDVLRHTNYDYECQRTGDAGVGPPRVLWVEPGTFEKWMRAHGKMGGQHKVPRVTAQADRFARMLRELGIDSIHQIKEAPHESTAGRP